METSTQPSVRLRTCAQLQVVEQSSAGRPYFVVKHGPSGKCFGLSPGSYQLLRTFDSGASVSDVAPRVQRAVERLISSGLLELEVPPPEAAPQTRTRRLLERLKRFNPFYIRIGTVNPKRMLRVLQPVMSPLFTVPGFLVFVVSIACAIAVIALNSRRFYYSFFTFRTFSSWTLAYVVLCGATVLHELGHAVACQRYGGEVREMGILLYFLQVGAYSNVTDAWMMPKRRHRIIVSLAGVYVEGFLFAIAIAVWAFTAWFSAANTLAFVLAAILAMRIVLNLFPLLRLDGYFVLSDAFEIRNLRPKAFQYVLSWLPKIGHRYVERPRHPIGRRIMLGIYGLLSLATIAIVMPAALWGLHSRVASFDSNSAVVVFWILLVILGPISIASLVRQITGLRSGEA